MVVISNGFKNFHLVMAAAEANARNTLTMYIAGAYPTKTVVNRLSNPFIKKVFNVPRFIARAESINDSLIRTKWMPEVMQMFSIKLSNFRRLEKISDYIKTSSFRWYSHQAIQDVREAHARGARIYHYRAGFGQQSARVARELGMITLCDHSIVHPLTLEYMIENNGRMPPAHNQIKLNHFWKSILDDFEYADVILVNSEFVKTTFISQGWDPDRVHVIYLGVDAPFFKHVKTVGKHSQCDNGVKLIFAGLFGKRKGADTLIESLLALNDVPWQLDIAGSISPYVKRKYEIFLNDPRVNVLGTLSRQELAERMVASNVFVFPSLAEGSARVIFEAMACGCYVITTKNSGSIVESGVHGEVVQPGDVVHLEKAIRTAAHDINKVCEIGLSNAKVIKDKYLQKVYGEQLNTLYETLNRQHDG